MHLYKIIRNMFLANMMKIYINL